EVLAGDGQAERVDHAEGVEIRGGERRLGHVEVFRMGCVVTPIVGRPRPLSRHRHAQTTGTCLYTLICEEPAQVIFFFPWLISPIVTGVIWRWLFGENFGLVNYLLSSVGLDPMKWASDP